MANYYFHIRTKNGTQPSPEMKNNFEFSNLSEAISYAENINNQNLDYFVMHIEELDTGKFEYL